MNANPNPQKRSLQKAAQEWDEKNAPKRLVEETHIALIFNGIQDIDNATLNSFTECTKLSLSSNFISKIPEIHLKNIVTLSLGRNKIKSIKGLEFIGGTLENLWLSYNEIDRLDNISNLLLLKTFYIGNNLIAKPEELNKLSGMNNLTDVLFRGNPFSLTDGDIKKFNNDKDFVTMVREVCKRIPSVSILDGNLVDKKLLEE